MKADSFSPQEGGGRSSIGAVIVRVVLLSVMVMVTSETGEVMAGCGARSGSAITGLVCSLTIGRHGPDFLVGGVHRHGDSLDLLMGLVHRHRDGHEFRSRKLGVVAVVFVADEGGGGWQGRRCA